MEVLRLEWEGMPHSLRFVRSLLPNQLIATLEIVKAETQTMVIELPKGITMEMIEQAWAAQGQRWEMLTMPRNDKRFEALRVIWLPNGHCLQWFVLHIDNRPYDSFSATKLTKAAWEASR